MKVLPGTCCSTLLVPFCLVIAALRVLSQPVLEPRADGYADIPAIIAALGHARKTYTSRKARSLPHAVNSNHKESIITSWKAPMHSRSRQSRRTPGERHQPKRRENPFAPPIHIPLAPFHPAINFNDDKFYGRTAVKYHNNKGIPTLLDTTTAVYAIPSWRCKVSTGCFGEETARYFETGIPSVSSQPFQNVPAATHSLMLGISNRRASPS